MSSADPLAEERNGRELVRGALSGEDYGKDDVAVTEEFGGPLVTTGETEFAGGTDPSNPPSATREPFPKS